MKKRSCRRNADEEFMHGKAVRLRKMTDEQLVKYVNGLADQARAEGYEAGLKEHKSEAVDIESIIERIGTIKGIGKTKLAEIRMILMKGG